MTVKGAEVKEAGEGQERLRREVMGEGFGKELSYLSPDPSSSSHPCRHSPLCG